MIASGRSRLTFLGVSLLMVACGGASDGSVRSQSSGEPQPAGAPQPVGDPQPTDDSQPTAVPQPSGSGQVAVNTILVSFKLDRRLTDGVYLGELWVSPQRYTGAAAQDSVEARAVCVDADGRPTGSDPSWIPSDPDMLSVSPTQGGQVTITVKRAGESRLHLTSQGLSKELVFRATSEGGAVLQVEILQ